MGKNRKTDLLVIGGLLIAIGLFIIVFPYITGFDTSTLSPYAGTFIFCIGIILIAGGLIIVGKQIRSEP